MNNPQGIPPNDQVRQQIFYLLKRNSSYTAWSRILSFYQKWADATELSLKEASRLGWEDKTTLSQSKYVEILKGLARVDAGVQRLKKGDKRVFQYSAQGDFVIGYRIQAYWSKFLHYMSTGDVGINEKYTPLWDEFVQAHDEMGDATGQCWPDIIEKERFDATSSTVYNDWLVENILSKTWFPNPLPDIPEFNPPMLVATGKTIPCTGIWEPVTAPAVKKVWSLFKKTPPTPLGPLPVEGTMAYLHGGSAAPARACGIPGGAATTWRLLWKDDRYEDGIVPEEELHYVFRLPEPPVVSAPALTDTQGLLTLLSGQHVPAAGRWLLEGDLNVSITLEKDAELPLHQGRTVRWIQAAA